MYSWNELKVGKRFIMDWDPYEVITYSQKVMGRGWSIINIKAKNLITWASIPKTFSDKDSFPPADITTSTYDYLYNEGQTYYFMNMNTYEQVSLDKNVLWWAELFMQEWDKVLLQEYNWNPINVSLWATCVLEVIETPPWEKWDTATWGKKPATMNTGFVLQVPLFINIGDKLIIDTKTGEYKSRA